MEPFERVSLNGSVRMSVTKWNRLNECHLMDPFERVSLNGAV